MKASRISTCFDWLATTWRTTMALQKLSSARNASRKRWRRKNFMEVLLRQRSKFGNSIEVQVRHECPRGRPVTGTEPVRLREHGRIAPIRAFALAQGAQFLSELRRSPDRKQIGRASCRER